MEKPKGNRDNTSVPRLLASGAVLVALLVTIAVVIGWPSELRPQAINARGTAARNAELPSVPPAPAFIDPVRSRVEWDVLQRKIDLGDSTAACEMATIGLECSRLKQSAASVARVERAALKSSNNWMKERSERLLQSLEERRQYCRGLGDMAPELIYQNYLLAANLGSHHAQVVYTSGELLQSGMAQRELASAVDYYGANVERLSEAWARDGNQEVALLLADAYAGRSESKFLRSAVLTDGLQASAIYAELRGGALMAEDGFAALLVLDQRIKAVPHVDIDVGVPPPERVGGRVKKALSSRPVAVNTVVVSSPLSGGVASCRKASQKQFSEPADH